MSDVDYEIPDVSQESDDNDEWFYGKIDETVDALGLPQQVFEKSCEICDLIRARDGFKYNFTSYGGVDAVVAASVFVGAKQCGVPLPSQRVVDVVGETGVLDLSQNFSSGALNRLGRKFRRELEIEPVFLDASDYVEFYVDGFEFPVKQKELQNRMYLSEVAVRYTYKEVVEGLTGLDTHDLSLDDVAVTPESFGYFDDSVEGFALHLLEKVEDEELGCRSKSPQVLAASVLYIAGSLLR